MLTWWLLIAARLVVFTESHAFASKEDSSLSLIDRPAFRYSTSLRQAKARLEDATSPDDFCIFVLGGSVVAGHGCNDPNTNLTGESCSWPARFANHLQERHPQKRIHYRSLARGGTTSAVAKTFVNSVLASATCLDLVLVDYSANEEGDGEQFSYLQLAQKQAHEKHVSPQQAARDYFGCGRYICITNRKRIGHASDRDLRSEVRAQRRSRSRSRVLVLDNTRRARKVRTAYRRGIARDG